MLYVWVCVFACVCGGVTDVMQRGIKDGELVGEDVLVHAEGLGVGATDVEVLLTENHAELRLERAEREEHTAETSRPGESQSEPRLAGWTTVIERGNSHRSTFKT